MAVIALSIESTIRASLRRVGQQGVIDGMGGLSRVLKASVVSLLKVPRGLLALNRKRGQILSWEKEGSVWKP
jgi:hypothetical protein